MTAPIQQRKIASDGVIGMVFLLATEAMFFAGLISAYIVNRAGAPVWPPAGQPRLPVEVTAINTMFLLASGLMLIVFGKRMKKQAYIRRNAKSLLIAAIILGATFLAVQGTEWVKLIGFGLTTHSSIYGAFFYTLIGMHGFHVLVGLTILLYLFSSLRKPLPFGVLKSRIIACSMYWYFVVAIWPILYVLVYL